MRINRFLSRSGLGSRRSVEELVRSGRVTLNGVTITDLAVRVEPATDLVMVDDKPIQLPPTWHVYMFNKPRGVVSTLIPQDERPCLDNFRKNNGLPDSVIPVGRLDSDSSGLLIWTDDGLLSQQLCLPATKVWKVYEVLLDAALEQAQLPILLTGKIELDGRPCLPARLTAMDATGRNWKFSIREGRNRQIRRMMNSVGREVLQLHRVVYGPLRLGNLAPGQFRELSVTEIETLRKAIPFA